jgi:hypothetical protein
LHSVTAESWESGREVMIRRLAKEVKRAVKRKGVGKETETLYKWVVCGEVGETFEMLEKEGFKVERGML